MTEPWAAYYEKADNLRSRPKRAEFWREMLERTQPKVVVEVGCGDGLNLEHLGAVNTLVGIDNYSPALEKARSRTKLGWLVRGDARDLRQLPDRFASLAFTCTTIQHIADDEEVRAALRELIRISRNWVLVMEYEAETRTPVAWRGDPEGIVKRPWGQMLQEEGLTIEGTGFLAHDKDGFDDVSWWLAKR